MRHDDVAMVLNGSFAPTHRLDLKIYWTLNSSPYKIRDFEI